MNNIIRCPLCGKHIGERIVDGYHSLGDLGCATMCHSKYDYRKASHVFWEQRNRKGTLCRKCAKEKFPEGFTYHVAFNYHGKKTYTYGGVNGSNKFVTRESAEASCKAMNEKHGGIYWVEANKI